MATEKEETDESQIALSLISKKSSSHNDEELCLFPCRFDYLEAPPSKYAIIIDNDEEETLESKEKKLKPWLGSWWNDVEVFDEQSLVVDWSTKTKDHDITSREIKNKKNKDDDGDDDERSSSISTQQDLCVDQHQDQLIKNKKNDDTYDDDDNDIASRVESCYSSSDLHKNNKKKKNDDDTDTDTATDDEDERTASRSSDQDLCVDHHPSTSGKGNKHVTLEELGVTVEDLKNIPWEAFDQTWKLKSSTMDP